MDIIPQNPDDQPVLVLSDKSVHTSDDVSEVTVYADIVKVKVISTGNTMKRPNAGKRQRITKFSKKSRKRMLEQLAMIRNMPDAYFITLTYGGRFDTTPDEVKRHLRVFRKAIMRRYPESGGMWRLELKKRKSGESEGALVPHYHILVWGVESKWLPLLRQWIRHTWTRIVTGTDCGDLLRTQCEVVTSRRHAQNYVSKYAAKDEDDTDDDDEGTPLNDTKSQLPKRLWGRRWGIYGNVDQSPSLVFRISLPLLIELKRLIRSWLKARGSDYGRIIRRFNKLHGASVFGLGDQSNKYSPGIEKATIVRMIAAAATVL